MTTATYPVLQNPAGTERMKFLAFTDTVEIQRWENCPKRPETFRYAGRWHHLTGNARNLWASMIRQGWSRIA
jgi:hypothetical protein